MDRHFHRPFNVDEESRGAPDPDTSAPPPEYLNYKPGSLEEFFRDIDAYQAACLIHKTVSRTSADLITPAYDPNTNDDTTPPYEDDDTSIFRVRFIATLSKLKEYMQNEEKKARWSTCFGMSDKGRFIISIVVLCIIAGAGITWCYHLRHPLIFAFVAIAFTVVLFHFLYSIWEFHRKRYLAAGIEIALVKVDRFERLNAKTVDDIKMGVEFIVPNSYWESGQGQSRRRPRAPPPPPPPPATQ